MSACSMARQLLCTMESLYKATLVSKTVRPTPEVILSYLIREYFFDKNCFDIWYIEVSPGLQQSQLNKLFPFVRFSQFHQPDNTNWTSC